jgi:HSP20 family molecular chaperone IbpA
MRMSVHGVQADRLVVEVRDDVLVVTGRLDSGPYSRSSDESDFHRLIGLPADAARTGATARLEGELLVVRIPKARDASGARLHLTVPDDTPGGR